MLPISRRRPAYDPDPTVEVRLTGTKPVSEVDRRYLSFSIDISVFAGGFWWEGSDSAKRGLGTLPVPPLNLRSKKLSRLAAALAPAYLRIGGSEADKIHYFERPRGDAESLVLEREQWDDLHAFTRANSLDLIFTCKYGLFKRSEHGSWEGSELEQLLRYSRERGYWIDVFELGNELNAYWAFHGLHAQPGARKLASDYDTFIELVRRYYPAARISGPGSAYWPRLGETIRPFTNLTPRFLAKLKTDLDIVDWHYYPFQSERSPVRTRAAKLQRLVDPKSFNDFRRYSRRLRRLRDRFQPQAELWTGETGSAQCGGQPYLSDRWASAFWWAEQLGQGARQGQSVMVRQALVGGDYGMVDRLTLRIRPDYWVSWLWRQLMGTEVYAVNSGSGELRCYLHSAARGHGYTLLLINLSDAPTPVVLHGLGLATAAYTATAKSLTSRRIRINGRRPSFNKGRVSLADFPHKAPENTLPPYSICFWCLASLTQSAPLSLGHQSAA
ncbi:MAG: glycoside hydrolase [Pseudomonadota bacterium]